MWLWSRIGEELVIDILIGMFILVCYVEVSGLAQAMVCSNELLYSFREFLSLCYRKSVCHMLYDDSCALNRCQSLVWTDTAALVLSEVDRVLGLSYVVIECAGAYLEAVCPNGICRLGSKVSYLYRMLERSGCLLREFLQELVVEVRQLNQCYA